MSTAEPKIGLKILKTKQLNLDFLSEVSHSWLYVYHHDIWLHSQWNHINRQHHESWNNAIIFIVVNKLCLLLHCFKNSQNDWGSSRTSFVDACFGTSQVRSFCYFLNKSVREKKHKRLDSTIHDKCPILGILKTLFIFKLMLTLSLQLASKGLGLQ